MFTWLESTDYAVWIQSSLWGWAIVLTLHAVGTATVVGINFVAGLRLVGYFRGIPYSMVNTLINVAWVGFIFNVVTGTSMFMSQAASNYMVNPTFLVKLAAVIAGIGVMAHIQSVLKREASSWDAAGMVSARAHRLAILNLVVWSFAIVVARLIAYLGAMA